MTRLTPAAARELQPGQVLKDHEVTGLQLRARGTTKSWHLYYVLAGVERRPKLGTFPEISLAAAREIAKGWKKRIGQGEDPSAEKQAARAVPTVSELCARYLEEYACRRRGSKAFKQYKQLIEAQIKPGLGRMKITEVTTADVDHFLWRVFNREFVVDTDPRKSLGPTAHWTAHHTRTCLRQLFKVAMEFFKYKLPVNPATGLPANPVIGSKNYRHKARRRHGLPDEIQRIKAALDAASVDEPLAAACVWTLFLCGGRVSEINEAEPNRLRVSEALRDGKLEERWVLHLAKHKTEEHIGERDITLPPQAVALIKQCGLREGRVFGHRTLRQLERFWDKVRLVADCPGLQLRDARRTFASYGLSIGLTLDQVGELLGHTDTETTKGYTYLLEELKRRSTDMIANAITADAAKNPNAAAL